MDLYSEFIELTEKVHKSGWYFEINPDLFQLSTDTNPLTLIEIFANVTEGAREEAPVSKL